MYRIKTMNKISPKGLARLDADHFEVGDNLEQEHAILVRSAKLHDYAFPQELLAIARAGAGVNNIPLERCSEQGIVVFNTPGANANAVKELAICALLLSSRDIPGGIQWVKDQAAQGADVAAVVEKGKSAFVGPEIMGKTLAVVGLGAIGILVANTALALGMDVIGYDPFLKVYSALTLSSKIHLEKDLSKIYQQADYISLHLPMNSDTKGSINAEAFAQMKEGVRIINMARGELVNNTDMFAALDSGKVAAYVTDFPDSEIIKAPQVIPIPHLGASTPESEENCAVMAAKQVQDYLDSGNIENSVNMPDLSQDWNTYARICMLQQGKTNLLSDVTSLLSDNGIHVEAMARQTKGDYAYMILDIDADLSDALLDQLQTMESVLRVRLLKK